MRWKTQARKHWKRAILFGLAGMAIVAICLPRSPSYKLANVHPSLRSLATPYRSVTTEYYLDGGSIGLRIVDRDGKSESFALPIGSGTNLDYTTLFVGGTYSTETNAVQIPFTDDTRGMLLDIIAQDVTSAGESDLALAKLRGSPSDYARLLLRALAQRLKSLW